MLNSKLEKQKQLNEILANILEKYKIKNLRLTSMGNSIASGYSLARTTKPLLLRNESIKDIMNMHNIELERYHFARAQNNSDEHVFEWLTSNIKESEIHRLNQIDYSNNPVSMKTNGLNNEKIQEYYNTNLSSDKGLQDILFEVKDNLANIIIYNGATGSFLDNITRNGKLSRKLTFGIKKDITSIEAILQMIQEKNRNKGLNIQIYLCGAPKIPIINASNIINSKLKNLSKKYANVAYVEPITSKIMYPKYEETPTNKYTLLPDIHYGELEYLKLINNILETIINNYTYLKEKIRIDRELITLNKDLEIKNYDRINDDNYVEKNIHNIIYQEELPQNQLYKIKSYLIERFPYDFYYLDKKRLKRTIK